MTVNRIFKSLAKKAVMMQSMDSKKLEGTIKVYVKKLHLAVGKSKQKKIVTQDKLLMKSILVPTIVGNDQEEVI